MAEDTIKVYTPTVIEDTPFPQEGGQDLGATQGGKDEIYTPQTTKDTPFPTYNIAVEVLGTALNTKSKKILQEFQFTPSGAIQIGKYEAGVSGDLRLSPAGITARDSAGNTTFAIDSETGSAVFAGTIQAGTFIAGLVVVGNNTWIIDGNPSTPRILLYNNGVPEILIGRKA
jgi:hypothetical protein